MGARLSLAHNADHKVVFRIMLPAVNDSHAS
jgi:hypothetical protein